MKIQITFPSSITTVARWALALAVSGICMTPLWSQSAAQTNVSTNIYGSGKHYKTTVQRHTQGELSAEDLHQASLLTSELLTHVNHAAQQLADSKTEDARSDIQQAQTLLKVVRDLLPTTIATTSVTDASGKEIYRSEQRVQDDQIPIFAGDIAVEVVEPIVEAKKDEAAVKGVKLANAEVIRTAVLVDLSYVERKLKRATELLNSPREAAAELALLQTEGVHFYAHKEDSPLVDVQHALRLAEHLAREGKYEGAKENLLTAKLQLATYRTLVDEGSAQPVSDLEKDIQKLSGELQTPGAADKIRGMWDRVAGWFRRESGQAHTAQGLSTK